MALTADQKEAFARDGFVAVHNVLTEDEVVALRRRTEQIIRGEVPFPSEFLQIEPELEGRTADVDLRPPSEDR
jgi:hypothetical protein